MSPPSKWSPATLPRAHRDARVIGAQRLFCDLQRAFVKREGTREVAAQPVHRTDVAQAGRLAQLPGIIGVGRDRPCVLGPREPLDMSRAAVADDVDEQRGRLGRDVPRARVHRLEIRCGPRTLGVLVLAHALE